MHIVDTHSHLWLRQDTSWNGLPIKTTTNGRSIFLGQEVQMLPPFMIDGVNSAEVFLSNMNYAQVTAAVVVQELIDGYQNDYLQKVGSQYPDRFIVCGMCDYFKEGLRSQAQQLIDSGFKGIAIPGHRLILDDRRIHLNSEEMMAMFKLMEANGIFLSLTLADGDLQVGEIKEVIKECPSLRIAIGHFCMPTADGWTSQLLLARHPNVMVESGGITWLYNSEFYPFNGAMKVVREAADLVGIDKLMWGSDYPRTITAITYRMSYDFVLKSDLLTEEEKALFLGENVIRFYGIRQLHDLPYIKNMSE
jgi:predicted TIM-barrel fold metal-dependent hydrolase